MFIKYPPLFYYQKLKDGNFTIGGMFKKFLDDAKEYFNMRYVNCNNKIQNII